MGLSQLKALDVHEGNPLERIKLISEAAAIEYQIKVTLEQIEIEVYRTECKIVPFKDTKTYRI